MAKNIGGRRQGAVRGRTQFRLPSGHYAKRDRVTGEILAIKADFEPFKGVIKEKAEPHLSLVPVVDEFPDRIIEDWGPHRDNDEEQQAA